MRFSAFNFADMKKSTIWVLGIVMGLSFLSLLYLQVSYIEEMVKMRKGQFDESVQRSLVQACRKEHGRLDFRPFLNERGFRGITVMAALELGKRRKLQETKERLRITCSKDIYDIFQPIMCDLEQEEFWVLLLNQATKLIDKVRISTGGIDGTYTDVRTILREALLQRATQIAVVHNHPSGNIHPSQPDRSLTEHIHKAAETMNIRLIDHVIVCEDGFFSFADEGLL